MADEQQLRSYLKRVTIELAEERRRSHASRHEPIAVVGMACRFPGKANCPEELWQLIAACGEGVSEFPDDRGWDLERSFTSNPEHPGPLFAREAGFVDGATDFDPGFFGISSREARAMVPQQRALLEVVWEAFEDAAVLPAALRGSETGVFVGSMNHEYAYHILRATGDSGAFGVSGVASSVTSGRIAYALGLEGPAITVDTACSSSLVAMHLASQALRQGECPLALAGGVSIVTSPEVFIEFSRTGGLAPDGRCKAFAEAADGTGFSEGVGMLVLERLSDAQRNGHQVLATIKGSAVNQDGASNGLTAPNGPSQERVIRQALANARLTPQDVDAVEAHGTGTTLGDPIEAGALLATYGQDREEPLRLGSIKSNIGHTQAAAGVAGVIKTVMAMREGVLPKTLHVDEPSSKVEWEAGKVELLTEAREWKANGKPRRAGVSSFGISGTNAHVILEEAPEPAAVGAGGQAEQVPSSSKAPLPGQLPLLLSAKTEPALQEQAARLASHLRERPELRPADVAYSLATTRSSFERRAVALGADREEQLGSLDALAQGIEGAGLIHGKAREDRQPVFLFPGQGSQHAGMAVELLDGSPVFAEQIEACEQALAPHVEWSLQEVLREGRGEWLERLDIVQPALFAVMVSLARLWRRLGVEPALVVGHSQGEIAAAHLAGGLSLEDAGLIVAERGKAMAGIAGQGRMLSVSLSPQDLEPRLQPYGQRISLAAINGPASLALSGKPEALAQFKAECEKDGVWVQDIAVDYAAHSAQIDALREGLLEAFAPISPRSGEIPFHSTVTGEPIDTAELGAEYWYRNLRQTVLLEPVLRSLFEQGPRTLIEIGLHPVLAFGVQEAAEAYLPDPSEAAVLGTLRRDEGTPARFALSLAEAHAQGVKVEWSAFFAGSGAKRVALPTYPFQRKRYWLDSGSADRVDPTAAGQARFEHPLLGAAVSLAEGDGMLLTGRLSRATQPWLVDHRLFGETLLPGSAFLELALAAATEVGCTMIDELDLQAPLLVAESDAVSLQVVVSDSDARGRCEIAIYSRPAADVDGGEDDWTCHARGILSTDASGSDLPLSAFAPAQWPPDGAEPIDLEDLYDRLAESGFEYGTTFQGARSAWRDGIDLYVEVALADEAQGVTGFGLHPALLDAAFHPGAGVALDGTESDPSLPVAWRGVWLVATEASSLRIRITPSEEGSSLVAVDDRGDPVVSIESVRARPVDRSHLQVARLRSSLHGLEWVPAGPIAGDGPAPVLGVLGETAVLGPEAESYPDPVSLARAIEGSADVPEVILWDPSSTAADGLLESCHELAAGVLGLVQEWIAEDGLAATRLAVLTRGAVAARAGEAPDLLAAPVWGLLRSVQAEHPDRFSLVDMDDSEESRAVLPLALAAGEGQLALRQGEALVPRFVAVAAEGVEEDAAERIDPRATVLIGDGTGPFGALLARHFAEHRGAGRLLLVSDDGPAAAGAGSLAAELEALGAEVEIAACDLADRAQLAALIDTIPDEHPLGAVIHAAVGFDDGVVASLGSERLAGAMRPKVDAAWHLHELTEGLDLTHFLLFSSAESLVGAAGQAGCAAANAFVDALAAHRQACGLPAISLAWGSWEVIEGSVGDIGPVALARRERLGLAPMPVAHGLELLDAACAVGDPLLALAPLDRLSLRVQAEAGMLPQVLRGLVRASPQSEGGSGSLAKRLASAPDAEREAIVLDLVRSNVSAVLGHDSVADVELDRAFLELGLDSLGAVELRNRLVAATGLKLPATLVFDYPTTAALARFLKGRAVGGGEASTIERIAVSAEEPIAVVGMACRYAGGVASPEELWQLVASGVDAISDLPDDRGWDLDLGLGGDAERALTRVGGFIEDVTDFDADFFGISPREALSIDPQQRLLLEASWEALEGAGLEPASLRGSQTGVFAGAGVSGYGLQGESDQLGGVVVGMSTSVISGRVSYTFGFEGPAITVDTACSSSLVAVHLASQSLRTGECSLALAGGVLAMVVPPGSVDLNMPGGLAPDGRCKAFAEAADGTGFSEGVGMLVLERLSDAQRNGHQVLATIKGSAVNQDGASNGLTAPNGPSQERVIRQALANARLTPQDVDAVEAHGTGTTLGDPIEAGALLATYGQDREEPLRLGSIKSNIGHSAMAAGVAGVIKTVMAMREGVLPKTLHVDEPSSKVEWEAGKVELLTEAREWKANGKPRRAGVSSFGISGTNAHVILEEAPEPAAVGAGGQAEQVPSSSKAPLPGQLPLLLSAKTEPALQEQAARLASHLRERPELRPADVAYSLATTRSSFERRAVALGADREEQLGSLDALAQGIEGAGLIHGKAREDRQPVFLFPGQGSQWKGMALDLIEGSPAFERGLRECEEALSPHIEWSVREVLSGAEGAPPIERIEVVQPVLFAVTVSLAEAWRACGVVPAAVVGHSQGEIAAAHIAGGLSLQEAAMLAAVRSQIISRLAGEGAMVSVALPPQELESRLERWQGRIEIAAQNGPSSTVLSADREAIDEFLPLCAEEGVRAREVPATIASHSARVEPLREELLDALASLSPQSGEIPLHSTVTGEPIDTAELGPEYWYRNLREPVRFEEVTRSLIEQGHRAFIEVSPHPVFALALGETVEDALPDPSEAAVLGTLRRDEGTPARFALSLAEAHAQGVKVEWSAFFAGSGAESVALPTYAFQRKRYWLDSVAGATGDLGAAGMVAIDHPLLGAAIEVPSDDGLILTGRISARGNRWIADHAVGGAVLLPSTALVELALQAGKRLGAETLAELEVEVPVGFGQGEAVTLRVSVAGPREDGSRPLSIHSRVEGRGELVDASEWICNARGILSSRPAALGGDFEFGAWPPEDAEPVDVERIYDRIEGAGLELGPAFRTVHAGWRRDDRLFAEVVLETEQVDEATRFAIHPALLDAAVHLALESGGSEESEAQAIVLPQTWRNLSLRRSGAETLRVCIHDAEGGQISLVAVDELGQPVVTIGAVGWRPLASESLRAGRLRRSLYRLEWSEVRTGSGGGAEPGLAIVGDGDFSLPEAERHRDLASLLDAIGDDGVPPQIVVVDERRPAGDLPDAAHAGVRRGLELLQAWVSTERLRGSRLVFVTSGAFAPEAGESPNLATAPLGGMVHTAHSEHLGRFALVDVDDTDASARALPQALALGEGEPQLAIRAGRLLAPRLARAQWGGDGSSRPIDPDRTVLITGGTSGIGAMVARHLVAEHGANHLLLVSRSGPGAAGAAELEAELTGLGADVTIAACDVADRRQLEALIDSVPAGRSLGTVIHSAAVLDNAVLESLDADRLERVMRPKVDAAWHLHELTKDLDLCQFLLFSSFASVLGSSAQANYVAANAFLDALASYRHAQGLPATSIAWGGWEQGTTQLDAERTAAAHARLERLGLAAMSPEEGLALFDEARAMGEPLLAPVILQGSSLRRLAEAEVLPAVLRGLVPTPARGGRQHGSLRDRLMASSGDEREAMLVDLVRSCIAEVLGHASTEDVEPDRNLQEMGFDSLSTVELRSRLGAATGVSVQVQTLIDEPTVESLAGHLQTELEQAAGDSQAGGRKPDTFVALLGEAREQGALGEFVEFLSRASRFRPSFETGASATPLPRQVRLSEGPDLSSLHLIASAGATSGTHEYVRFAKGFRGSRDVIAQPLPGFLEGEALPARVSALSEVLAEAIAQQDPDRPFVLGGHSSGGWVAHAVASQLESAGLIPSAVLLLDTYWPQDELLDRALPVILAGMDDAGRSGAAIDDARLTAMGAYLRLFADWQPEELAAPTFVVRANEPAWGGAGDSSGPVSWQLPHTLIDVPGDHFSMMLDHADNTARTVQQALLEVHERQTHVST